MCSSCGGCASGGGRKQDVRENPGEEWLRFHTSPDPTTILTKRLGSISKGSDVKGWCGLEPMDPARADHVTQICTSCVQPAA